MIDTGFPNPILAQFLMLLPLLGVIGFGYLFYRLVRAVERLAERHKGE